MMTKQFMALVRQADTARDRHDWAAAETGYAAALALHPYERSYWVQLGHVAREQGRAMRAEIAYRTACAFGEPPRVLAPFIAAVEQPGSAAPSAPVGVPDGGETRSQPPGYPDLALLAALAGGSGQIGDDEALGAVAAARRDGRRAGADAGEQAGRGPPRCTPLRPAGKHRRGAG